MHSTAFRAGRQQPVVSSPIVDSACCTDSATASPHHEPLIKPAVLLGRHGTPLSYSLDEQVAMISEVLAWIDPAASAWLAATAGSTTLLSARQ